MIRRIVARYLAAAGSDKYERAVEEHNKASRKFKEVLTAYRAQKIGDDEFIAARKVMQHADADFDKAFEAEVKKRDEETASAEPDPEPNLQLPLF